MKASRTWAASAAGIDGNVWKESGHATPQNLFVMASCSLENTAKSRLLPWFPLNRMPNCKPCRPEHGESSECQMAAQMAQIPRLSNHHVIINYQHFYQAGTLWWTYKKLLNMAIFYGKTHYKRPFSIAFCMFTRGYTFLTLHDSMMHCICATRLGPQRSSPSWCPNGCKAWSNWRPHRHSLDILDPHLCFLSQHSIASITHTHNIYIYIYIYYIYNIYIWSVNI